MTMKVKLSNVYTNVLLPILVESILFCGMEEQERLHLNDILAIDNYMQSTFPT